MTTYKALMIRGSLTQASSVKRLGLRKEQESLKIKMQIYMYNNWRKITIEITKVFTFSFKISMLSRPRYCTLCKILS